MAKRELSSTLKNLKFMQRAAQREDKSKKEEEVILDGNFQSPDALKKCMVIVEGDPHPGAIKGRMSFQSFNPSIDKLNEEATNPCQSESSATCSGNQNGRVSDRENGSTQDASDKMKLGTLNNDANGELKRKQAEITSETQRSYKSQKSVQVDQETLPDNGRSSNKKSKREKLDWSVLRPPKGRKQGE